MKRSFCRFSTIYLFLGFTFCWANFAHAQGADRIRFKPGQGDVIESRFTTETVAVREGETLTLILERKNPNAGIEAGVFVGARLDLQGSPGLPIAYSGDDFPLIAYELITFPADGVTEIPIEIPIFADSVIEGVEYFEFTIVDIAFGGVLATQPYRTVLVEVRDSETNGNGDVLIGDLNDDGCVNVADLNMLGGNWLQRGDSLEGDINTDGIVDSTDLNALGNNWQVGPEC